MTEAGDLQALLRRVWDERRDDVLARAAAIEAALATAAAGRLDDERRDVARRDAHTLAGSLGTFGLVRATELARTIEKALRDRAPEPQELPALAEAAAALRREIERGPRT